MNRRTLSLVALTSIALIYACNHSDSDGGSPSENGGAGSEQNGKGGSGTAGSGGDEETAAAVALQPLTSCADFNDALREKTRRAMNAALDAARDNLKKNGVATCMDWGYGTTTGIAVGGIPANSTGTGTGTGTGTTTGTTTGAPSSVSGTNNQVASVDEADIVKTDGQYIYWVENNELRIVDVWPASDAAVSGRLGLGTGRTAKKLFVQGDRAVVYLSEQRTMDPNGGVYMRSQSSDCTYGYDCDFSGDGTSTRMMIFDVSDRSQPKVIREISMPGSLIAARRIGKAIHTVVSIAELQMPAMEQYYPTCGGTDTTVSAELAKIEAIRATNDAKLDNATFDVGVLAREGANVLGSPTCSDFYREGIADGTSITTLLSLDLDSDAAPKLANVISRAGAVYASESSLYISVAHQRGAYTGGWFNVAENEVSTVHRFKIGEKAEETGYLASGLVPGHVLNQFSMDEYKGALRIATSKGRVPDPNVESVMTVLSQEGAALNVIGQIDGIAPTEDIRSVRFQGDRGYLVTFKKTDPLFVLDLADPKSPKIKGELKIPGFSTYMHPLDENHLLALGYEADDHGDFAYFNGIQLQIFDVTNPTQPALIHKKVFGTRGSSSSALTDHLGFTFLPERKLLTLPISICEGGGDGMYGSLDFSGVVAMKIDVKEGISELGRLEEPYPQNTAGFYYGGACSDWWTNSSSVVKRTVVLDDFLYALSSARLRIQNLTSLGTDVKVLDF